MRPTEATVLRIEKLGELLDLIGPDDQLSAVERSGAERAVIDQATDIVVCGSEPGGSFVQVDPSEMGHSTLSTMVLHGVFLCGAIVREAVGGRDDQFRPRGNLAATGISSQFY
jgi:hypothetical protein